MNWARLKHRLLLPFFRRRRIEHGILTGRYTVNEGRRLLGLPTFDDLASRRLANTHLKVDRRGVWMLEESR